MQGGAKLPRRSSASGKEPGGEPGGVQPVLVADCGCLPSLLSGELQPSPASALVLEDDAGVCGCALALIDAKEAADKCQVISGAAVWVWSQVSSRSHRGLWALDLLTPAASRPPWNR